MAFGPRLSWRRADGTGEVEVLSDVPQRRQLPHVYSPDGTTLVFADAGGGLNLLTLEEDRTSTVLLNEEEFTYRDAALSPDGRWLAYTSDETGQLEVHVRPFPDVESGRWQISSDGGWWPVWHPSGNELFYRGPTDVMAREFEADTTYTPGVLTRLFAREPAGCCGFRRMDVSPDGERFLLLTDASVDMGGEDTAPPEIHVFFNWFEVLTERVPVD